MSKRCSKQSKRSALTLIEVVASIALLSTLLVIMLKTYSAHVRQINRADQKLIACAAIDTLLAETFRGSEPLPVNREGAFANNPDYLWRSTEVPSHSSNPSWQTKTIRIDAVFLATNESVASVELLVSEPRNAEGGIDRGGPAGTSASGLRRTP